MPIDSIRRLFGSELPIIQSPMAGARDSTLTIGVSNAGGLGSLLCGMLSIEKVVSKIKKIKEATTNLSILTFFAMTCLVITKSSTQNGKHN